MNKDEEFYVRIGPVLNSGYDLEEFDYRLRHILYLNHIETFGCAYSLIGNGCDYMIGVLIKANQIEKIKQEMKNSVFSFDIRVEYSNKTDPLFVNMYS